MVQWLPEPGLRAGDSQAGQVCRVSRLRPGAGAGLSLVRASQFRAVIGQKAGGYLVTTGVRIPLVTMLP